MDKQTDGTRHATRAMSTRSYRCNMLVQ